MEQYHGKTIEKPVHEDITYDEVYKSADNLWNFLFFTGYFKKVGEQLKDDSSERCLTLQIPNHEVDYIFWEKIMSWFREKIQADDLTSLYAAFVDKNAEAVQEELNRILLETISSLDEQESYYHGLAAGLLSPMKGYRTKSNREAGKGRCDLLVKPVSRRKEAFVVEFKVAKRLRDLEAKADEALRQIEDRKYVSEFDEGEVTEETLTVAFPNTAVLYLRTYKKTPDKMKYVIIIT